MPSLGVITVRSGGIGSFFLSVEAVSSWVRVGEVGREPWGDVRGVGVRDMAQLGVFRPADDNLLEWSIGRVKGKTV